MAIVVRGATLSGLATAARLARLGHQVVLAGAPMRLELSPVVLLPALWRDLFKKSGCHLVTELNGAGLKLVAAPSPQHCFPDGSRWELPTDRASQFYTLRELFDEATAKRWRDLLDDLDQVWQARRRFGIESLERPTSSQDRQALWLDRTLGDLAEKVGQEHLAQLILSQGPLAGTRSQNAPALLATRLVIERTFGRWQLLDEQQQAHGQDALVELLWQRLYRLGVEVSESVPGGDVVATPRRRPWARAALAPLRSELVAASEPSPKLSEQVRHSAAGPVISWALGGRLIRHDYRSASRDATLGPAPSSAKAWAGRPRIDGKPLRPTTASPAGLEPWGQLASAALASYVLHERLTGQDVRPTNRKASPIRRPVPQSPAGTPSGAAHR